MLSGPMLGFLKRLVNSDDSLDRIIQSYVYSERYIIAVDFQIMYKKLIHMVKNTSTHIESPDKSAPLFIRFLNKVIEDGSLDKTISRYNEDEKLYIAVAIHNIKEILLEDIRHLVDDGNNMPPSCLQEYSDCESSLKH